MTKYQKLLSHAKNNPKGLSFNEFQALLRQSGRTFDHQKGNHQIWYSPDRRRLPIQEAKNGKAKGYQVEQFWAYYEEHNNGKS